MEKRMRRTERGGDKAATGLLFWSSITGAARLEVLPSGPVTVHCAAVARSGRPSGIRPSGSRYQVQSRMCNRADSPPVGWSGSAATPFTFSEASWDGMEG
jgi:hypothetical protein